MQCRALLAGGFHWGTNDPELFVRWFQFAALSPTLRLHSTRRGFEQRLPWGFGTTGSDCAFSCRLIDLGVEAILRAALQLRCSLMPYIYSSHYLQHNDAQPLIGPSYIYYPTEEDAYVAYNQYFLGTELLVCPYVYRGYSSYFTPLTRTTLAILSLAIPMRGFLVLRFGYRLAGGSSSILAWRGNQIVRLHTL